MMLSRPIFLPAPAPDINAGSGSRPAPGTSQIGESRRCTGSGYSMFQGVVLLVLRSGVVPLVLRSGFGLE